MDNWVICTPGISSAKKRTNTDEESQNTELNAVPKKQENTMRILLSMDLHFVFLVMKNARYVLFATKN